MRWLCPATRAAYPGQRAGRWASGADWLLPHNYPNTVFFVMMLCFLKETCGEMQLKSWEAHSRTHAENLWDLFRAKHLSKMIPESKKWGTGEDVQSKVHACGGRREVPKELTKDCGAPWKVRLCQPVCSWPTPEHSYAVPGGFPEIHNQFPTSVWCSFVDFLNDNFTKISFTYHTF